MEPSEQNGQLEYVRDKSTFFKTTYTQEPCVEISKSHGFLPIFSRDLDKAGNEAAKVYMATGYQSFWNYYKDLKIEKRQHYEIILPSLPCRLHIDAEVKKTVNPHFDKDEEEKIERGFLRRLKALLIELEIVQDKKEIEIRTLGSSNAKKYSKHFIIDLKNKMFKNNFHVGAFMRRLEQKILLECGPPLENKFFFKDELPSKGKVIKFIADMAIYTVHRNFRIYASSKSIGGYRPLVLEGQNPQDLVSLPIIKETLFSTLIQYTDPEKNDIKVIECLELDGTIPYSHGTTTIREDGSYASSGKRKNQESDGPQKYTGITSNEEFPEFVTDIKREIEEEWEEGLQVTPKEYNRKFGTIRFECRHHACRMKREGLNDPEAVHKNHIFFVANLKKSCFVQCCYTDNETCWKVINGDFGETKKIRKTTREYKFSPDLCSRIKQYMIGVKEGDVYALANTIVTVYELWLKVSEDD